MDDKVFFIDANGNMISIDNISSHIGLANEIMKKDKSLQEEFKKSGKIDPVDFLVLDKGYIKLAELGFYKKCVYSRSKLSERQKEICMYFKEKGYELEDQDFIKMIMEDR